MSPEKAKMDIQNPRRILAVALDNSAQHLSDVIKDLTGTHPLPSPQSYEQEDNEDGNSEDNHPEPGMAGDTLGLAGTTHALPLTTPYYTASVPVWLDLVSSPAEWSASFLSSEAREVLDVLGGVLVVFALPYPSLPPPHSSTFVPPPSSLSSSSPSGERRRERARELITHVGKVVREGLGGWEWDGVGLVVGIEQGQRQGQEDDGGELDEWEDLCAESGLEFVHVSRAGPKTGNGKGAEEDKRNEFGERVGMARVIEALKANDWSGGGGWEEGGEPGEENQENEDKDDEEEDDEFDPEKLDLGFDKEDFAGLRKAIWSGNRDGDGEGPEKELEENEENEEIGEEDVQQLERMMLKLQAVRDASAGLPEEQRKKMAARAVGEVMKELR
ncbi:alpha and gamma adaptin binding protein p34-domain-containing protein [Corynascus novoguineensis]|uniref:Alpha and gamma adaptin binding protein p34-domain-containing protein n=1 Tax=Corynascus novoguineensis TaxID=1126955 RepID=A0AAN7CRL6_9PEZI|nr:alpha and gamma adaptin binding protein p34-domain-containing protein [Corynascus novoguineensis]